MSALLRIRALDTRKHTHTHTHTQASQSQCAQDCYMTGTPFTCFSCHVSTNALAFVCSTTHVRTYRHTLRCCHGLGDAPLLWHSQLRCC